MSNFAYSRWFLWFLLVFFWTTQQSMMAIFSVVSRITHGTVMTWRDGWNEIWWIPHESASCKLNVHITNWKGPAASLFNGSKTYYFDWAIFKFANCYSHYQRVIHIKTILDGVSSRVSSRHVWGMCFKECHKPKNVINHPPVITIFWRLYSLYKST